MLQPKPQWEWGNDTSPHPPSSLHYTLHGRRSIMVVIHWPPTLDEMKPCDVTAVVLYCPTDQMSATLVLPIIHFLTRNIIKISSVFLKLVSDLKLSFNFLQQRHPKLNPILTKFGWSSSAQSSSTTCSSQLLTGAGNCYGWMAVSTPVVLCSYQASSMCWVGGNLESTHPQVWAKRSLCLALKKKQAEIKSDSLNVLSTLFSLLLFST